MNSNRFGRWQLYDEKYHLNGKAMYDAKRPEVWLQEQRDYLSGRTQELDAVIGWIERQDDEISPEVARTFGGLLDCASIEEISRQMWSFLGPLLKEDSAQLSTFRNVQRHNGLEAWRRMAEPINEDKAMVRKELFTKLTNPKPAGSLDRVEEALRDWDTNLRLFAEADGPMPSEQAKRISLVGILPK